MLAQENRLNIRYYFSEIRGNGRKISSPYFSIYYKSGNELHAPQVGFVISKKVTKKAYKRNRMRRLLIASLQPLFDELKSDAQILFFVYKDFSELKHEEVSSYLNAALKKSDLYKN